MTHDELAQFHGQNGQPAYVAVSGIVYDVSTSPLWKNGDHEAAHQAGCDLTDALKTAPHVAAVIERFPSVGTLEAPPAPRKSATPIRLALVATCLILILAWVFLR